MKYSLLVTIHVLAAAVVFAQPPDSLWSRTFGGSFADYCHSVQPTTDGGYILGGSTRPAVNAYSDFYLVKTDANGDSEWTRAYGRGDNWRNYGYSVLQTTDGGYILAGCNDRSSEETYSQFGCVRTNAAGDSLWSRAFGTTTGEDFCYSVMQTADGGYILGGSTLCRDADFRLVKLDGNGDSLWSRTIGSYEGECCHAAELTTDGGCVLAGCTYNGSSFDFAVLKTDSNGDSLWSRTYGGSNHEQCYSVQQTMDGGYILGGYTNSFGAGGDDFWLVKTDANGDSLWSRSFGGNGEDICYAVEQTMDGGYILAGCTYSFGSGGADFWLVRTYANGDSLWSRTFGGSGDDVCYSVHQMADASYILAGNTTSFGAGNEDFWLVKTGPDPEAVELRILQPLSLFLSASPNPFNPSTEIRYDLAKAERVSLRVFDLQGREVAVLEDGLTEAGTHRVIFDGGGLASGIYFARLDAGARSRANKLVLLK